MTCFWNGILKGLKKDDLEYITKRPVNRWPTIRELIIFLKKSNRMTDNVTWNSNTLSKMEKEENKHAIKTFNISGINNGYGCSTCDPFLLLICEIFCVNINHFFLNKIMRYENKKLARKTITFRSNYGHFWC